MREPATTPAVVVGVDGSRSAVRAALWAVDEAVSRDIPLRLICVVDQLNDQAHNLATARGAISDAVKAIEATDKPVKVESEIVQGCATRTLVSASHSAALVCVGSVGFNHFQPGRMGSTAAVLATAAHCPVAIIPAHDLRARRQGDWIIVDADDSPDTGVLLETAVEEARLRDAPLRVIACWQSQYSDIHDLCAVGDGDRRIRGKLDSRLARWTHRYPDLHVETVVVHGSLLEYLAKNADCAQLLVVGARDRHHVQQLVGPAGNAALRNADCSVLIVDHQHL